MRFFLSEKDLSKTSTSLRISKGLDKKLKSSHDLDESFVKSSQDLGEVCSSISSTMICLGSTPSKISVSDDSMFRDLLTRSQSKFNSWDDLKFLSSTGETISSWSWERILRWSSVCVCVCVCVCVYIHMHIYIRNMYVYILKKFISKKILSFFCTNTKGYH